MLRSTLRAFPARGQCSNVRRSPRIFNVVARARYSTLPGQAMGLPRPKVLRPTLWTIGAVATIFLGCASYEVYEDAKSFRRRNRRAPDLNDLEWQRYNPRNQFTRRTWAGEIDFSSPSAIWRSIAGHEQLMLGVASVSAAMLLSDRVSPLVAFQLAHMPARPNRNWTMLTSVFLHAGFIHYALNMYGLYQFTPPVAVSPTFLGSGSQLTAFFLSSGVVASLSQHLLSIWPMVSARFSLGLGASGAIFGLLGAYGMSYPDDKIGIVFVPGSVRAQEFLGYWAAFEVLSMFVSIPLIGGWGHGAHLGGMAAGVAYVAYGGRERVWMPTRRVAFNVMRRLNVV